MNLFFGSAVVLLSFFVASLESARLGGYELPRPQSIYQTPLKPVRPPQPPKTSYRQPARPPPPPPRPYRPPQNTYKPPRRPPTPRPPPPSQAYRPSPPKPSPPRRPTQSLVKAPSSKVPSKQYPGMPYDFQWGVEDPESGNSFSHVETSDGKVTKGSYQVLLPDGRVQVVTFYDDGWGFVAEVTYQ